MVKSINTLTIRQYSMFERTGRARYLMYLPLPFFRKQLERLIREIAEKLGGDDKVGLSKEWHRVKSIQRIQYLTVLYQAVFNLMINQTQINAYREALGKTVKENKNLIGYLKQIQKEAKIVVSCPEDLIKLAKHIEVLNSKYLERFKELPEPKGMTFSQIVIAVFSTMGMNIQYNVTMADFFELKKQAEEISKKYQDG